MSVRTERIEELLLRELSEIIRREFSVTEVGLLNINRVKVARDLQQALVFVGCIGSTGQKKKAALQLEERRKDIQADLGRSVVLRFTPVLKFLIDESVEKGNRVLQILNELEETKPPADA